jgi:hypothetical protein
MTSHDRPEQQNGFPAIGIISICMALSLPRDEKVDRRPEKVGFNAANGGFWR